MGIDKPDIRNIVHFDLPSSIEAYSQQIGRAGRDGRTSTCMLFVSNKDFHMKNVFIFGDCPSNYALKTLFEDLQTPENLALRDGDTMEVNLQQQSKIADIKVRYPFKTWPNKTDVRCLVNTTKYYLRSA